MRKFKKIFLCLLTAVIAVSSTASCADMFIDYGGTNSGSSLNISGFTFDVEYSSTTSEPSDLVEVLKRIRPSVVEIYVQTASGTSSGSGVVISIDSEKNAALIVTCHHVIEDGQKMIVKSVDGTEFDSVSLVGSDPKSDIGVIIVDGEDISSLSAAKWYKPGGEQGQSNADYIDVGTAVVAIGNPLGVLGGTVTQGIISAVNREVNVEGKSMVLLQTDAAINGGNSGGGLFNASTGDLVGIVNAGYKSSSAQGLSFAIGGNTALAKCQALLSTYEAGVTPGYIEGNYDLGVELSIYQSAFYFHNEYYIGISSVDPYGSFAKAGLRVKDLIKSIKVGDNDEFTVVTGNTETLNGINAYINKAKMGDTITVKYLRDSEGTTSTVTFTVQQYVYGK